MNTIKNTLVYFIGLFFIISSFSKLYPIEPFELQIAQLGFSWKASALLSRLIIIYEFSLGIAIFLFKLQKKVLLITLISLVFFSFSLIYIWVLQGQNADCGCLGTWLQMPVKFALLRNVIMGSIVFWAVKTTKKTNSLPKWLKFQWILFFGFTLLVVISNPADNWLDYSSGDWSGQTLEIENYQNNEKRIVAFFSPTCKHCQLAAKKLEILTEKGISKEKILIVFMGKKDPSDFFWEITKTTPFEYKTMPAADFLRIGGNELPGIFLLNPNQEIHKRIGYRDFDIEEVYEFMKN